MYLMYVDESGDCGHLGKSPSQYFVLTGLVVHELRWQDSVQELVSFRRGLKARFGLRMREELHAGEMICRSGPLARIPKNDRLAIIRSFADKLGSMQNLNLIPVVVDKMDKPASYDMFEMAWKALIQRFDNTLSHRNFAGPANPDERGMLFPDHTDDKKLRLLLRKMRRFNPVPNQPHYGSGYRNLAISKIIEDPNFRRSDHSYFTQAADLAAFLLYQRFAPNTYMRKKGARTYFGRLSPIVCKAVTKMDPEGIVLI